MSRRINGLICEPSTDPPPILECGDYKAGDFVKLVGRRGVFRIQYFTFLGADEVPFVTVFGGRRAAGQWVGRAAFRTFPVDHIRRVVKEP